MLQVHVCDLLQEEFTYPVFQTGSIHFIDVQYHCYTRHLTVPSSAKQEVSLSNFCVVVFSAGFRFTMLLSSLFS